MIGGALLLALLVSTCRSTLILWTPIIVSPTQEVEVLFPNPPILGCREVRYCAKVRNLLLLVLRSTQPNYRETVI